MRKSFLVFALLTVVNLHIFECDFGDEKKTLLVDLPQGVTNVEQYQNNLCEKIAEEQGR